MSRSSFETRLDILSFKLPRLETRLLGVDPETILTESELHLFHAAPVAEHLVVFSKNPRTRVSYLM